VLTIVTFLKKPWVFLILIILLALGLRIFHLNLNYVFGEDEEYQTNIALTLVKHFHIIWIGVSAANTGFYLGPFWSYFTYIWLLLSHGDPLLTAYVAALLGSFTAMSVFYVGWKMFSLRVGIVASVLYSCLPLIVFFDQKYWNPSAIPLLSVTMTYSLYKIKENQRYLWLFAFAYGLVFHAHLSLVPFIFLAFYSARKGVKKTVLLQSIGIFILTISPLIAFDYFHKFSNITTPLRLNQIISGAHPTILVKVQALVQSVMRLFYIHPHSINANEIIADCSKYRSSPSLLAAPFVMLIIVFFFKKQTWAKDNTKFLGLGILLITLSYIFFPGGTSEYYLLGLFPLLLFIPGIVWNKYISPLLILLICLLGMVSVLTAYNPYGLASKKQIISQIMSTIGTSTFELTEKGECHQAEGWRYLFKTYARVPERSSIDPVFSWLYPKEISNVPAEFSVEITGHDRDNPGFTYKILKK